MAQNLLEALRALGPSMWGPRGVPQKKCFDLVEFRSALLALQSKGVPDSTLLGLGSLWLQGEKHLSAFGQCDPRSVKSWNGIPQGCALSVLACNCLVEQWLARIRQHDCEGASYVDDRYIIAPTAQSLRDGAQAGHQWEGEHCWVTNMEKSIVAAIPPLHPPLHLDDQEIHNTECLRTLGTEVPLGGNAPIRIYRERTRGAELAATRVGTLRLPTRTALDLVEAVIVPKFCYQAQARPIPDYLCRILRSKIKAACGLLRRSQAWEITAALIRKPHRLDPFCAAAYCHMVAVMRALRLRTKAWQIWNEIRSSHQPPRPRGPLGTWRYYLRRLRISEADETLTCSQTQQSINWLTAPWDQVATS